MSKTSEETADFLFPLTRHTRADKATLELKELSRLPIRQVEARAKETHKDCWLARETLVAVVRGFLRAGNQKAADTVLTALIDRLRPDLKARARAWRTLSPVDFNDAEGEAVMKLMACARSTEVKEEFWECNFAHCFKFRVDDVFKRAAGQRKDILSLNSTWADGDERDRLDETPDAASESAFNDIETQELIQTLNQAVPGIAEYRYLHEQGYTDKEIAVKMNVTDRTLRNWKDKARAVLTTLRSCP